MHLNQDPECKVFSSEDTHSELQTGNMIGFGTAIVFPIGKNVVLLHLTKSVLPLKLSYIQSLTDILLYNVAYFR